VFPRRQLGDSGRADQSASGGGRQHEPVVEDHSGEQVLLKLDSSLTGTDVMILKIFSQ
jgi:hypothetical protein